MTENSRLPLGIATMMLPRTEIPFLESWLRYHAAMGIHHFWIWNDGDGAPVWYRSDEVLEKAKTLTTEEVMKEFHSILDRVREDLPDVEIVVMQTAGDEVMARRKKWRGIAGMQGEAVTRTVPMAFPKVKWLTFLDVDELLVCSDFANIDKAMGKHNVRQIRQFTMDDRWTPDGVPIPYDQITTGYGHCDRAPKCIIRTEETYSVKWGGPHNPVGKKRNFIKPKNIHHLHFHGPVHIKGVQERVFISKGKEVPPYNAGEPRECKRHISLLKQAEVCQ